MLALCFALVAVVALADLLTGNIHVAILYTLPLVLYGHLRPKQPSWLLILALVILTYLGILFGPQTTFIGDVSPLPIGYRLVNRTLTAVTLITIGALQQLGLVTSRGIGREGFAVSSPRQAQTEDLLRIVDQLRGGAISLVIAVTIAALDMLSPATFNLPILYVIPLVTCLQVRSRSLLWSLAGFSLLLSAVGYLAGVPGAPGPVHNRLIAAASIVLVAAVAHRWMAPERRAVPDAVTSAA
jgi:hypothetical protein